MSSVSEWVGLALLVVLGPAFWAVLARHRLQWWHVGALTALALVAGAVAWGAVVAGRGAAPGWGRLGPGVIVLGAGLAAGVLASAAFQAALVLIVRDSSSAPPRSRRVPRRLPPTEPHPIDVHGLLALGTAFAMSAGCAVQWLWVGQAPNLLPILGLRQLRLYAPLHRLTEPHLFALQVGIAVVLAVLALIGLVTWARRMRQQRQG